LGHENFKRRELALEQLLIAPLPPLDKLAAAAKSPDPEVAWRAKVVLAAHSAGDGLMSALRLVEERQLAVGTPLLMKILAQAKSADERAAAERAILAIASEADRDLAKELLARDDIDSRNLGRKLLAGIDRAETLLLLEGSFEAAKVTPGGVSGGGPNLIDGWQFSVKSDLTVTHLSVYDSGSDGLKVAHEVAIWDLDDEKAPLTATTVPAGDEAPLVGVFRVSKVKPVKLAVGKRYAVVAHYPDVQDANVSLINPSGLTIEYGLHVTPAGRRYSFPHKGMAFPDKFGEGEKHATMGPSFRYESSVR
jgi:hypothetical protein